MRQDTDLMEICQEETRIVNLQTIFSSNQVPIGSRTSLCLDFLSIIAKITAIGRVRYGEKSIQKDRNAQYKQPEII